MPASPSPQSSSGRGSCRILSIAGLYIVLSWLGYWRLGGDWLRLGTLGLLGLALLVSVVWLARVSLPGRLDAMRRVELASGLPHRPARGLSDKISAVANDAAARTLWDAEQARLHASLENLRVGVPRPDMARRDPNGLRFAIPVLLVLAFAVGWGEWATRLGEAFIPFKVAPLAVTARIDAWVDPPPYTRQAPVFLSRRPSAPAATTASTAAAAPQAAAAPPLRQAIRQDRSACRREASSATRRIARSGGSDAADEGRSAGAHPHRRKPSGFK